jgi:arylsulfatase A-like enzyme
VIEQLVTILEQKGLAEDTLLVVTSDHGETFTEDGRFRGRGGLISDITHRVPLVVYAPGVDLRELTAKPARHVDIVPTVLDLMQIESDGIAFQGTSLLDLTAKRPVFLHNYSDIPLSAVVEEDATYVHSFATGATWQFPTASATTEDSHRAVSGDQEQRIIERITEFTDYNEAYLRDSVAVQQTW